jgi:hypothetical protein
MGDDGPTVARSDTAAVKALRPTGHAAPRPCYGPEPAVSMPGVRPRHARVFASDRTGLECWNHLQEGTLQPVLFAGWRSCQQFQNGTLSKH